MTSFEDFLEEMEDSVRRVVRVDVHETVQSDEMFSLVKKKAPEYNMEAVKEKLEVGDYAFRNIGIERKEGDYIKIGDVLTKAEELKEAYDHAFIMISTDLCMLKEEHKDRDQVKSLDGLTASLVARDVSPIFCSSRMDMVNVMLKIFDKISDEKDRTIREPIRPQPTTDDWKEHVLRGLPHVGSVKAKKLMEDFETIREVMVAPKEKLKSVDGIGDKIADDILEVINE